MAHGLRQDIRLSQQLVMSPQLQLAIKLLQLSRLELVEMVREELDSNPVLEEDGSSDDANGVSSEKVAQQDERKEIDWEAYLENCYERPLGVNFSEESEESSFEATLTRKPTRSEERR